MDNKIGIKTTVKDLIEILKKYPEDTQVFVANDEELNNVFYGFAVDDYEVEKSNNDGTFDAVIIYPLDGGEDLR